MQDFLLTEAELRARESVKWRKYPPDVLPAFVADLDFKVAPAVQAAMERLVDAQDYVYGVPDTIEELYTAFARWMGRRHGWNPDPALTIATSDVIQGVVATLVAYSDPGDGVVVQTPIYPPFVHVVPTSGRRFVGNPLAQGERFTLDADNLAEVASGSRVILLCNPHNPTGRVFERNELMEIASVAERFDLTIISDEIHADVTYGDAKHIPMETVVPERTVTLTSATKSFNIPGTRAAIVHFGTAALKARFDKAIPDHLLGRPSRFGADATIAAWSDSEGWLDSVMAYLAMNRELVAQWAASRRGIRHVPPEATFLAWLDCRELGLTSSPYDFFLERAKVGLGDGRDFAEPGDGFVRLNFGTSTEILQQVLERMSGALDHIS
ncbi:MAG TPA: PatB family C-S lyase [Candidatus Dormibacteraeota bacterium]|nr:PatB family C-S lyase [Candidatus Dormibacteraeota bacterium]